jgi:hypothetical protein
MTNTPTAPLDADVIQALTARAFVTSMSGNREYIISLKYETLAEMQDAYAILVASPKVAIDTAPGVREALEAALCAPDWSKALGHVHDAIAALSASPKVASDTAPGTVKLDERCGFHAPNAFEPARSTEWRSACEHLASRYDFWKMPDRAAAIRAGEPGWLIEQACVEAILAALSASPSDGSGS